MEYDGSMSLSMRLGRAGFYERLVGLTKRALRKSLGKCCTTSVDLRTLLAEIEAILNSRPLVHVGDDINSV